MSNSINQAMSLAGHQRLARVIHLTLAAPLVVFLILCYLVIPLLPPTDKQITFMPFFLGFSLICAVVVDSLTFMRLRVHLHPLPKKLLRLPPSKEDVKKGWTLGVISWILANLYVALGAFEAIGTRDFSKMIPFFILGCISLIRCRPRLQMFIAPLKIDETQRDSELKESDIEFNVNTDESGDLK